MQSVKFVIITQIALLQKKLYSDHRTSFNKTHFPLDLNCRWNALIDLWHVSLYAVVINLNIANTHLILNSDNEVSAWVLNYQCRSILDRIIMRLNCSLSSSVPFLCSITNLSMPITKAWGSIIVGPEHFGKTSMIKWPAFSGLFHRWHWDYRMTAQAPSKQSWRVWVQYTDTTPYYDIILWIWAANGLTFFS